MTQSDTGALMAIAGPDAMVLRTPVELRGEGLTTVGDFAVSAGRQVPFVLTHGQSHPPVPEPVDAVASKTHVTNERRDSNIPRIARSFRTTIHAVTNLVDRIGIIVPLARHIPYTWRLLRTMGVERFVTVISTLGVYGPDLKKRREEITEKPPVWFAC